MGTTMFWKGVQIAQLNSVIIPNLIPPTTFPVAPGLSVSLQSMLFGARSATLAHSEGASIVHDGVSEIAGCAVEGIGDDQISSPGALL